jgi:hypothetical protein
VLSETTNGNADSVVMNQSDNAVFQSNFEKCGMILDLFPCLSRYPKEFREA